MNNERIDIPDVEVSRRPRSSHRIRSGHKKVFVVFDASLVVFMVFALVRTMWLLMSPQTEGLYDPLSIPSQGELYGDSILKPLPHYMVAVKNRLFGDAGATSAATVEHEPPSAGPPATGLPLKVLSTTTKGVNDPYAHATIRNRRASPNRRIRVYFVGDEIMAGVKLAAVSDAGVLIIAGGREHIVPIEPESENALSEEVEREYVARSPSFPSDSAGDANLSKQSLMQSLIDDDSLRVVFNSITEVTDGSGNVIGVTADEINDVEIAATLGFRNGDILQEINGQRVTGKAELSRLLQQFSNVNTFRIGVLRDGKPVTIKFRIE